MIRLPRRAALRVADNHIQITAVDPIMLQPGTFYWWPMMSSASCLAVKVSRGAPTV